MGRPKINFLSSPPPSLSWKENLSLLKSLQQKETKRWQDEIEIEIKTTSIPYFLFCPLSDTHIGASGVNYEELQKYVNLIKDYGVQTALIGDLGDFFMPQRIPEGMLKQLVPPQKQAEIVKSFLEEIKEGILAVVPGNHDDRFFKITGFDIYSFLTQDLKVPLLSSGGIMNIKVDNILYRARLFHKIRRLNSQFNYTHAGKQALRLGGFDGLDMIISADRHLGAVETTTYGDRRVVVAQLGTFKTEEEDASYVQRSTVFFPVFVFDGRRKNIEYFTSPGSAVEFYETMAAGLKLKALSFLGL